MEPISGKGLRLEVFAADMAGITDTIVEVHLIEIS